MDYTATEFSGVGQGLNPDWEIKMDIAECTPLKGECENYLSRHVNRRAVFVDIP